MTLRMAVQAHLVRGCGLGHDVTLGRTGLCAFESTRRRGVAHPIRSETVV